MRRRIAIMSLVVLATLAAGAVRSQDLAALEAAEKAVVEAWNASPIGFRRAIFLAEPPAGFGIYDERPDAVFALGEPIIIYAEPFGYAWQANADGTFSFGFEIDLLLKTAEGVIMGGQEKFKRLVLTSHARNREFMLTLTLNIDGAPAGEYVVEYRTRDIASQKAGTISLPFVVAE